MGEGGGLGVSDFFLFFYYESKFIYLFFSWGSRGGLNKLSLDNHFSYYYLELWPFEIFIIMNLLASFPKKCSS